MKKILIIDREYSVRKLAAAGLRKSHVAIMEADSGLRALALLVKDPPDLVLIDYDLSCRDPHGREMIRCLKNNPQTSNCPVLLIVSALESLECHHFEPAGIVKKPFSPIALRQQIETLLAI